LIDDGCIVHSNTERERREWMRERDDNLLFTIWKNENYEWKYGSMD
jgi:hypothetical protein